MSEDSPVDPTVDNEPNLDEVGDEAEESGGPSNLAFGVLAVALLVMVGASVFFVGSLLGNASETEAAAESAAEQIEAFEQQPPVTAAPETTPPTVPFAEDETSDPEEAEPEPDADDATVEEEEEDEEFTGTQAPLPTVDPETIGIVFVNRTPGDDYGKVGYIDRAGGRNQTELECERIDLNANGGICLDDDTGIGGGGRGLVLGPDLNATLRFGINLPSRAAASPDGEVVAWTGFSLGHSYLAPGEFATITQLVEVERGIGANLETIFTTWDINGERIVDDNRNFWGVTFVDSDRFYATIGVGESTSIVEGTISTSTMNVVHENATCPEISPDGSTLVVKERTEGDFFQLVAIDVATGTRRNLPEARSVEDQVEFLDNGTIIYGLPNEAEGTESQPAWDVWSLDLNGGQPQLIIPFADSPAAI